MAEIRFIEKEETTAFREALRLGFGGSPRPAEDAAERNAQLLSVIPLETLMGAFDERMVATLGSFDFDLTVPGGVIPMAGTTMITVQPTHRRRGILTEMMDVHLRQAIDRAQPLAGLWASDERIYGRFGYGVAAELVDLTLPGAVELPPGPPDVALRPIDPEEAALRLPAVYDVARTRTPGFLHRTAQWWTGRRLRDDEDDRDGASSLRIVLAERDGSPVGYVTYRQKSAWPTPGVADGTVRIDELVALDDDTRRRLWNFTSNVDLFPNVEWWNCPVDDPVLVEVDRPRRIRAQRGDSLWLRLLDVRAALEARRYEYDGAIVLGVTDQLGLSGGTYRLRVERGVGHCEPTSSAAEVDLDVAELGALYLGGRSALTLARADRIHGSPGAILTLDRLFRTASAPHCPEVF